jgi:nicotinamide-nucleotide amidase
MTDRNRDQALVPDVCTVVPNALGTAPGMLFERQGTLIFSMPGVPYEMKAMFTDGVVPILKEKLILPVIENRHLMTSGIGESWLADTIEDLEAALPKHITLAYLPAPGVVKLRLTGRGQDKDLLAADVQHQVQIFSERIGKYVYGYDEETLPAAIGRRLLLLHMKLSVAESCTGGHIGHLITGIPGCSAYFNGSVVSYDYHMKETVLGVRKSTLETHGAVSAETISEMLQGIQKITGSDFAIAVSGVAGPGGGTPEKPVGTVFIGVAGPDGQQIKKHTFGSNRAINIEYSSMYALHALRMMLDAYLEKQGISG